MTQHDDNKIKIAGTCNSHANFGTQYVYRTQFVQPVEHAQRGEGGGVRSENSRISGTHNNFTSFVC